MQFAEDGFCTSLFFCISRKQWTTVAPIAYLSNTEGDRYGMGKGILTALVVVPWSSHHLKASRKPKIHFNKQRKLAFGERELHTWWGVSLTLPKRPRMWVLNIEQYLIYTQILNFNLSLWIWPVLYYQKLQYLSRKGSKKIWLKLRYKWDSKNKQL